METFKCSYCLIEKSLGQVGLETKKNVEKLELQKEIWERELAKITASQVSTNDKEKKTELERIIVRTSQELENINFQIKNNQEKICKSCLNQFKKKDYQTFTCAVCRQSITGKKLGGHVANYQDEGISVRKWSYFCQSCKDTRIIEANIYCPRKGEGRDDDWDITLPLFDCDCPVSEEKQII